jgi:SPP1 family predicted phage head-tail adaptor
MRASRLKHRIDILQENKSSDGYGGFTSTWSVYLARWADVQPRTQKEQDKYDQVENVTEVMIRTRYHSGITEDMRIRHRDQVYEIISLINVRNANTELEINVRRLLLDEDVNT